MRKAAQDESLNKNRKLLSVGQVKELFPDDEAYTEDRFRQCGPDDFVSPDARSPPSAGLRKNVPGPLQAEPRKPQFEILKHRIGRSMYESVEPASPKKKRTPGTRLDTWHDPNTDYRLWDDRLKG